VSSNPSRELLWSPGLASVPIQVVRRRSWSGVHRSEATAGAGLLDRLLADDYARSGMEVLTLDPTPASLPKPRFP
jgi:hypothetical protein